MIELEGGERLLKQWMLNKRVIVDGFLEGTKVEFSKKYDCKDSALPVAAYAEGDHLYANIPNILLQSPGYIRVYVRTSAGDPEHHSEIKDFKVAPAEKPEDYAYTETPTLTYEALDRRVDDLDQLVDDLDQRMDDLEENCGKGTVKSINGVAPDENGNVELPDGVDVSGAEVGQIIKITSVDEIGKPTAWEAVDMPQPDGYTKFKETERGKTVFHAVIKVQEKIGASGILEIIYLTKDISEQMVAEAPDGYEVTFVHTAADGTVTTYTGIPWDTIGGVETGVGALREFFMRIPYRSIFWDNGTVEVTVKTASEIVVASPHSHYVPQNKISPSVEWETELSEEVKALLPTAQAVQDGLQIFGQTYTAYVENVSAEPIEIALQPRTFYYFGNTPQITVNRAAVSGAGSYCCFMFHCGETATELRDSVDTSSGETHSYGWPSWNLAQDTIKPNRTYKCVIHHGTPYLEEYTCIDTNAMTELLGNIKDHVVSTNSDYYWVPNAQFAELEELYNKYSYMNGRIGVAESELQQAYAELTAARGALVERVQPPSVEYTLSAYTAVGGETYRTVLKSTSLTATEGMHLIKLTVPAFPEGYGDEVYKLNKMYFSVKSGAVPNLTINNDAYAITSSSFRTEEMVLYFKPGSDTSITSFRSRLECYQPSYANGAYGYKTMAIQDSVKMVTYNSLLAEAAATETTEE